MYTVVLGLILVAATGEKHSTRIEMDSIAECYEQAQARLEAFADEFPDREEMRIGAGCWLVKGERDAKGN